MKKDKLPPQMEFTCNICGKKGYNKYWMELHIARTHGITDDRKENNKEINTKVNW